MRVNRWEYYREMDRRRTFKRWAGMFNVIGAVAACVCILTALGLLLSLTGWVEQDLSQSVMNLINTVVSVILNPVGDAVIQLG